MEILIGLAGVALIVGGIAAFLALTLGFDLDNMVLAPLTR